MFLACDIGWEVYVEMCSTVILMITRQESASGDFSSKVLTASYYQVTFVDKELIQVECQAAVLPAKFRARWHVGRNSG